MVSVMLISVHNIKLICEWHKAIKLNYKNTRTHVIVVLRVTKHYTCAVAARNVLEPAVDKDGQCAAYGYYVMRTRYSMWNHEKTTFISGLYLRNRSNLEIGVFGNIGNTLPKFCPFLLEHPVYTVCIYILYVYYICMYIMMYILYVYCVP